MSADLLVFEDVATHVLMETTEAEGVLVIEREDALVIQESSSGSVILFPSSAEPVVDVIELEADLLLIDEEQVPDVRLQETGEAVLVITSAGLPGSLGPEGPTGGIGPTGPPGEAEVPNLQDLTTIFENGLF